MSALPFWPSIHPVLMQLSALLLLTAPLLIVVGLFARPPYRFRLLLAAFVAMALGTSGDYLAQGGSHAAVRAVRQSVASAAQQAELIQTAEFAFVSLTLIFASIVFLPRAVKAKPTQAVSLFLPLVFLVFYSAGLILLANAAKQQRNSPARSSSIVLDLHPPGAK